MRIFSSIESTDGVERILDHGIRAGRWGDHFSPDKSTSRSKDKLTLTIIQANNSWLRYIPMLTKTKAHCVLEINEADAKSLDISDGQEVILSAKPTEP
ncbi:MAG: anaerobic selenocysteine-containing dehydrogenase [Planctomycetaceae bacterium]